jgi:hypothetical protein
MRWLRAVAYCTPLSSDAAADGRAVHNKTDGGDNRPEDPGLEAAYVATVALSPLAVELDIPRVRLDTCPDGRDVGPVLKRRLRVIVFLYECDIERLLLRPCLVTMLSLMNKKSLVA